MSPEFIRNALDLVAQKDPDLAAAIYTAGYPEPRTRAPGFGSLINIIIGQQVSTHAARAIQNRLRSIVNPLTPIKFLATSDEILRDIGLSTRKVEYGRGIAAEIANGTLDLGRLASLDDDKVSDTLTRIRGLGPWSADIYMLFSLDRANAWPKDDLAIQVAVQKLRHMQKRPNRKSMEKLAQIWQPYRGVVALFLWHYYKNLPS